MIINRLFLISLCCTTQLFCMEEKKTQPTIEECTQARRDLERRIYRTASVEDNLITNYIARGFHIDDALLLLSVKCNKNNAVKLLLHAQQINPNAPQVNPNARDDCQISTLFFASGHGYEAIVNTLLDAGANPNEVDGNLCRATSLDTAAYYGYTNIVTSLLQAGADRFKKNWIGAIPQNTTQQRYDEVGEDRYKEIVTLLQTYQSCEKK